MHTEQSKSGVTDGADHRRMRQTSPLNPPAAARSGPLRKSNFLSVEMIAKDRVDVDHMITDVLNLDHLPAAFEAPRKPVHQCKVMREN